MKKILTLLLLLLPLATSAQNNDRYVVMISLDGFRWDYNQWYDTPTLDRMAAEGVEAGLVPSFPSKTFPNHYAIATGLVPDHHGIIHNTFLDTSNGKVFTLSTPETKMDPRYWGGEPIWLTAKRQGVRTAVFYWPGSDVAIQGEYPDTYYIYDKKPRLTPEERIDAMLAQLRKPAAKRPHLIMGYMEEPDHTSHQYGPQHKNTRHVVEALDSLLMRLYDGIKALPYADKVDFLVVADHGMALITPEQTIPVNRYLKPEWYERIEGNMPALIYARKADGVNYTDSIYNALKDVLHLSVWKHGEMPAELSYGTNPRCGDVIASPDLGWIFWDGKTTVGGMHGFDPGFNEMHAVFRAVGPDFKNVSRPHFRNVNVYPLVCRLLGIKAAPCDGDLEEIEDILK